MATFRFLPKPVERGWVDLVKDDFDAFVAIALTILLAVVVCEKCSRKTRLIPCDVIARKRYSVRVIAYLTLLYSGWQEGLRKIVVSVYGESPSFTTLHEWTKGLGAHALGRDLDAALSDPYSAVLAESTKRAPSIKTAASAAPPFVDERRYRSPAQRERLAEMAKLLSIAATYAPNVECSLLSWREHTLRFDLRAPFAFRTGLLKPAIGHRTSKKPHDPPSNTPSRGASCEIPAPTARSPPSAST